jgi:hypothetical protein
MLCPASSDDLPHMHDNRANRPFSRLTGKSGFLQRFSHEGFVV